MRNPRNVGIDHDDEIRVVEVRRGIVAEMQWMVVGKVDVCGIGMLDHRQRERLGQRDQTRNRCRIAPQHARDDERPLGVRDQPRHRGQRLGRRRRRHHRRLEFLGRVAEFAISLGQHLARQAQIDGAARLRHRDRKRAAHHGFELLEVAQLVVPLDELAHDRALIERLLAPMDQRVAAAGHPRLGQRRAAGAQHQRHVGAKRVHQRAERVGRAGRGMDHRHRRLAGHQVVAVRHADGAALVRDHHRARRSLAVDDAF